MLTRSRLLLLLSFAALVSGSAQDPEPAAKSATDLENLRWITGSWRRVGNDQVLEERWDPPLGNSMTGTFRWLKNGVGWVYEFLLIEKTDKGVVFYLRHLGPGSVAWEPQKQPLDFPLKSVGEREVVFEHPERNKMKRLIYRRPKDDLLIVRVEGIGSDGRESFDEFRFERVPH